MWKARYGWYRYFFLMCLAIYAYKCGVSKQQLRQDMKEAFDDLQVEGFNHQVKITQGVLEEECSTMLSDFFKRLREKKKQEKATRKLEQERLEAKE